MEILGDVIEEGTRAGNLYNKYQSKNFIERRLLHNFEKNILQLISLAKPETIHEAGCGEGYWTLKLKEMGYDITGSDFSAKAIECACKNAKNNEIDAKKIFSVCPIQNLDVSYRADMILALEVLEHLQNPADALLKLHAVSSRWLLCSVPNEPIWSILNMCRGKYWQRWGNTPGHLQRFTPPHFINLLEKYFNIIDVRKPLPWTIVLASVK